MDVLESLHIRSFKSFADETQIPLRGITVLLGKNNSGKTAVARLPLLLLSAAARRPYPRIPLPLRTNGITFASDLVELSHGRLGHGEVELGYTLRTTDGEEQSLRFTIQLRQSLQSGSEHFVSRWSSSLTDDVTWIGPTKTTRRGAVQYTAGVTGFDGIFPTFSDRRQESSDRLRRAGQNAYDLLLHLASVRAPLRTLYETRLTESAVDTDGVDAPLLLNEYAELEDAVSAWYAEQLGVPGLRVVSEASSFHLELGGSQVPHNLARAGQGLQQVLPIVTYLHGVTLGVVRKRVLVLEEPELHLHPAAHGAIADLAVRAIDAQPDTQVLLETHSENLILRLRRRVADGELDPERVNLLWFDNTAGVSTVREIRIRTDGTVSAWPSGVFQEDLAEVRAIVEAARR